MSATAINQIGSPDSGIWTAPFGIEAERSSAAWRRARSPSSRSPSGPSAGTRGIGARGAPLAPIFRNALDGAPARRARAPPLTAAPGPQSIVPAHTAPQAARRTSANLLSGRAAPHVPRSGSGDALSDCRTMAPPECRRQSQRARAGATRSRANTRSRAHAKPDWRVHRHRPAIDRDLEVGSGHRDESGGLELNLRAAQGLTCRVAASGALATRRLARAWSPVGCAATGTPNA